MSFSLAYRRLDGELGRIALTGQDRVRFLSGMVTCDVKSLTPGSGAYGALLSVKGKVVSDFIVLSRGDAGLLLIVPALAKQRVIDLLDRYIISDDAVLSDESQSLVHLGVYGEQAAATLLGELPQPAPYHFALVDGAILVATRELGPGSFSVLGSAEAVSAIESKLAKASAQVLPDSEADMLRIEAGRPKYGVDFDEERLPQEASLEEALCFTKGCFLGQEVVVRLRDRGQLNRKLVGLRLSGQDLPSQKAKLSHTSRPQAGELTSVARSPRFGLIALGYVHRSLFENGTQLDVTDENGASLGQTATVSPLPFA